MRIDSSAAPCRPVRPAVPAVATGRRQPSRPLRLSALTAICLLAACAVHEPAMRPDLPMPARWTEPAGDAATVIDPQWWRGFNSAQLDTLVGEALAGSGDLRIAAQRVQQAEIALGLAGVGKLPIVNASASTGATRADDPQSDPVTRKSSGAGLSASYEVDLWGRIAAGVRAGEATLAASQFDQDAARLSVTANVAIGYFQWLATQERLAIARENLATAERVLRVVEARRRNEVATALEVSQQRTTVLAQRTALEPLALQQRQIASALALLLGRVPQAMTLQSEPFAALAIPEVTPGLPSSLLYRRPDLAAAEAQLAAADANVEAARAALLPTFALSASGNLGTAALLSLANPSTSLSVGLSLAQNIFDSGRLRLQARNVQTQRLILLETYAAAVRSALKEVDDGLGNVDVNRRQEVSLRAVLEQARESLRLAELRYREGAGDLLAVLDAQRTLFAAQDSLVIVRLARLSAAVGLYRALGGGWAGPAPLAAGR